LALPADNDLVLLVAVLLLAQLGDDPDRADVVRGIDPLAVTRKKLFKFAAGRPEARITLRLADASSKPWTSNTLKIISEWFYFPAGRADRLYATDVGPATGMNMEQNLSYRDLVCYGMLRGKRSALWSIEWRQPAGGPAYNGKGLAGLIDLPPTRIRHKAIREELSLRRGFASYGRGDGDSPWYEFFQDEGGVVVAKRVGLETYYEFPTLVAEQSYLARKSRRQKTSGKP
jgi:hypothetical protein